MPKIEITLEQLRSSPNWAQVFAEENDGNVSNKCDECPPGAEVDLTPPKRADVCEIIAAIEHVDDSWNAWSGVGVFLLADGRYLVASGECDDTGWD